MSPMISTPASRARTTAGCGSGKVSGMPGDSTSAATLRQSTLAGSTSGHLAGNRIAHLGAVVPGQHLGPAFKQRAHRGAPRFRETQNRDPLSGKLRDDNHRLHRSFSVASPAIARMTAMIQKRITIFGSSQPSCSK